MKPSPIDILCAVSRHTGIHPSVITDVKARAFWEARALYAILLRELLQYSYTEIAMVSGYASHGRVNEIWKSYTHGLTLATGFDLHRVKMAVMSELTRSKPTQGSAVMYGRGRSVVLTTLLDGSISLTSPNDPEMSMHAASASEALKLAGAWLRSNTETEAA